MDGKVTIRQLVQRDRKLRPERSPHAGAGVLVEVAKRHARPTHGGLSAAGRRTIWRETVERMLQVRQGR
jgi:hypothetical protein